MSRTVARCGRYELFTTLWIMAFTFHYLDSHPFYPLQLAVGLAAVAHLANPASVSTFAAFLSVTTVVMALDWPAPSNHVVLAFLVHLALIGAGITHVSRRLFQPFGANRQTASSEEWLALGRTAIGTTLLAIYFFTVLHKFNYDFFNPDDEKFSSM